MFTVSSYTKITQINKRTRWHNTISKKTIGYSEEFQHILPKLLLQSLDFKSKNLADVLLQIILSECVYRGLIIPTKYLENELEYLQNITYFTKLTNGFFNSPVIDSNLLNDKQGLQFAFIGIP